MSSKLGSSHSTKAAGTKRRPSVAIRYSPAFDRKVDAYLIARDTLRRVRRASTFLEAALGDESGNGNERH